MQMEQQENSENGGYPVGRGYGHDYMRGGEVLGGYGYSQRSDYEKRRGEELDQQNISASSSERSQSERGSG
jgi:hypothetical protein